MAGAAAEGEAVVGRGARQSAKVKAKAKEILPRVAWAPSHEDNGSHRGAKASQWNGSKPHPIHTPTAAPFSLHSILRDQKQNHHHTPPPLRPHTRTHTRFIKKTSRGSWPA